MTLIAMLDTDIGPVLFGDLLLSASNTSNKLLHLPTLGDVTDDMVPSEWSWAPVGLRPKVAIIDSNLAIAWAGVEFFAGMVVKELASRPPGSPRSVEEVYGVIDNITSGGSLAATNTYLVSLRDDKKFYGFSYGNCEYLKLDSVGIRQAWMAGSGSTVLRDHLKTFSAQNLISNESSQSLVANNSHQQRAAVSVISVLGLMMKIELLSYKDTLLAGFGGGYEKIILHSNGFQYVDDVGLVFWSAEVNGPDIMIRLPYKVSRMVHFHGAPIIRTMRLKTRSGAPPDEKFDVSDNEIHTIAPFDALKSRIPYWPPARKDVPSLRAPSYLNVFAVRELGTQPTKLIVCVPSSGNYETGGLEFDETTGLRYSAQFIKQARNAITRAWRMANSS